VAAVLHRRRRSTSAPSRRASAGPHASRRVRSSRATRSGSSGSRGRGSRTKCGFLDAHRSTAAQRPRARGQLADAVRHPPSKRKLRRPRPPRSPRPERSPAAARRRSRPSRKCSYTRPCRPAAPRTAARCRDRARTPRFGARTGPAGRGRRRAEDGRRRCRSPVSRTEIRTPPVAASTAARTR
jgi:hypothetical protein